MVDRQKALLMMLTALLIYPNDIFGGAFPPEFADTIQNVTVSLGRDATFTCLVNHLGGYRVGWLKVDTKAIQAIHDHVITHNNRVSVSHSDHTTWNLHIKNVQEEDEGRYMCQINTDPMKSQIGMLSVVVPPDFIPEETSSDVMVREGGQVKLTCRARGVPAPSILWRREDGKNIIIRKPFAGNVLNQKSHGELYRGCCGNLYECKPRDATRAKWPLTARKRDNLLLAYNTDNYWVSREKRCQPNYEVCNFIYLTSVNEYHGEELRLMKISRNEMGVYLCIAINGVPPAVSKRISINVHFSPVIHVPNQLVGAPLGTDVVLECFVEASPKSINYWVKDNAMIISSQQHDVQIIEKSRFEVQMVLTIRNLQKDNVGTYKCMAKNSLGDVESSIRLYKISGPAKAQTAARPSVYDEEDETVYGSAEIEKIENKLLSVDNTINGYVEYPSVATSMPTVRIGKKRQTIGANSNADHRRQASDLLIVLMLIIGHQKCQ